MSARSLGIFFFGTFLLFTSLASRASNPGSSYGCLVWDKGVYTTYQKTDYAPGNPYWGPFPYYTTAGTVYTITYSHGNYPQCNGCINPNYQFTSSGHCFVTIGGLPIQGALGTIHHMNSIDVPLDHFTWIILLTFSLLVFFKRKSLFSKMVLNER